METQTQMELPLDVGDQIGNYIKRVDAEKLMKKGLGYKVPSQVMYAWIKNLGLPQVETEGVRMVDSKKFAKLYYETKEKMMSSSRKGRKVSSESNKKIDKIIADKTGMNTTAMYVPPAVIEGNTDGKVTVTLSLGNETKKYLIDMAHSKGITVTTIVEKVITDRFKTVLEDARKAVLLEMANTFGL